MRARLRAPAVWTGDEARPSAHSADVAGAPTPSARPEELGGYRLEAFGNSRYWQVIDPAGELVCVAVYKRGGREVMRRLAA